MFKPGFTSNIHHALLAAAILLSPITATAQTQTPASQQPAPSALTFTSTPMRLDSLGLTMYLPEGSTAQTTTYGGAAGTIIDLPDQLGGLVVYSKKTSDDALGVSGAARDIIKQLLASVGTLDRNGNLIETNGQLLARDPNVLLDTQSCDRFYVRLPSPEPGGADLVRGFTIAEPAVGQFIIFELLTEQSLIARAQPVYEAILGTARFANPGDIATRRGLAIKTGLRLFEQITPTDLDHAIALYETDQWSRFFKPSSTGSASDAEEVGYRRMRARRGFRGEIDPNRAPNNWSEADRDEGYLVWLDARLLDRGLGSAISDLRVIDTRAIYFLSDDRQREAWSVNMSIRTNVPANARLPGDSPTRVDSWQEIGARDGTSMNVSIVPDDGPTQQIKPIIGGEGYISMVESFMLPHLLVRSQVAADSAYYAYSSADQRIRLRHESVKPSPDRPGVWIVESRRTEDHEPQTGLYTEDGTLIRIALDNGQLWEPIDLKRLFDLWQRKGLPLD